MKSRRLTAVIFLILIFLGALFLVNRDIGRFEYHDAHVREFSPETDEKGGFSLGDFVTLKPGLYELRLQGTLPGKGADVALQDESGETLFEEEFAEPSEEAVFRIRIVGPARRVRIFLGYDPACGPVRISHITLRGNGIFYKDKVIRRLLVSCVLGVVFLFCLLRVLRPETFFRCFPFLRDPRNERSLLFLLALTLLVSFPCLDPGTYIRGTDTLFHLSRLQGITADLKAGIFPPRIELFWLDDTGYGVGFYYPELFLIPAALCLFLGYDLLVVYKLFSVCYVFCILLSFFLSAKMVSGGKYSAGISAAVFIAFAVYRLQNQFGRDGLGESISYIFLPVIAAGLYRLFERRDGSWKILALGFTGTLLSHTLSFFLAVILTAVFLLIRIRTVLRDRGILADLVKAVLFSLGLGAFFLFPMLEQRIMVPNLKINRITSGKLDLSWANDVYPFRSLWLYRKAPDPGRETLLDVFPGWSLLAVPLLRVLLWKRFKRTTAVRAADILAAAGLLTAFCSTDFFPWQLFPGFLNIIQFSWRLLQSATVMLCLAGALYFAALTEGRDPLKFWIGQFLFCVIFALPIFTDTMQEKTFPAPGFFMQNNHTYGGEYMPVEMSRQYIEENKDVVTDMTGQAEISNFRRGALEVSFDFRYDAPEQTDFTVPLIYYYGYKAELIPPDGSPVKMQTDAAPRGFVRVTGPELESGTVRVFYRPTAAQRAGDILTVLTVLIFLTLSIRRRKNTGNL